MVPILLKERNQGGVSGAPGHSAQAHKHWHHKPTPDCWGEAQSLAEPQSRREGSRWQEGGMSLPPGRLVTLRQERACHQAHK